MNNKEDCRKFILKVLGLEVTEDELSAIWIHMEQNQLTNTSPHGGNVIASTPKFLYQLIKLAKERTGLQLEHPKFKKVSEEILPAIIFTLFLKHNGQGEYLIVSSDNPDITLINYNQVTFPLAKARRLNAMPLEAAFIPQGRISEAQDVSPNEAIANFIIEHKIRLKRYAPGTTLLVTLNDAVSNINPKYISNNLLARDTPRQLIRYGCLSPMTIDVYWFNSLPYIVSVRHRYR